MTMRLRNEPMSGFMRQAQAGVAVKDRAGGTGSVMQPSAAGPRGTWGCRATTPGDRGVSRPRTPSSRSCRRGRRQARLPPRPGPRAVRAPPPAPPARIRRLHRGRPLFVPTGPNQGRSAEFAITELGRPLECLTIVDDFGKALVDIVAHHRIPSTRGGVPSTDRIGTGRADPAAGHRTAVALTSGGSRDSAGRCRPFRGSACVPPRPRTTERPPASRAGRRSPRTAGPRDEA